MYDPYKESVTDSWDWAAQCALWRERALHSARRAAYYQALLEAERNGTTVKPKQKA